MRSSWLGLVLNLMTGILVRGERFRSKVMHAQRRCPQGMEAGASEGRPWPAGEHWQLEGDMRGFVARASREAQSSQYLAGLQNREGIRSRCFQPPVCGNLFQKP